MEESSTPFRINLTREEVRQVKIHAAKADKPMSRFVADVLRQTLKLKGTNGNGNGRKSKS